MNTLKQIILIALLIPIVSWGASLIDDSQLDLTNITLNDFTNDAGFLTSMAWSYPFPSAATTTAITFSGGLNSSGGNTTLGVVLGSVDAGGATFLEIPNGTNPTANDPGEIAHDTSDNQLILDDYVVARATQKIWGITVASTSPAFINGETLPVPTELDGYTMTAIRCKVDGGTSKVIAVEDASANSTEDITCTTSVTSDDGSITNASVTAAEEMYIDFGASDGAVNYVTISVFGQFTRE